MPVGFWTRWHDSGIKSEEGWYVRGARDGTWQFWDEDSAHWEIDFKDGEPRYRRDLNAEGWCKAEGPLLGSARHGEWAFRKTPDRVNIRQVFDMGALINTWHFAYSEEGVLLQQAKILDDGYLMTEFHSDGSTRAIGKRLKSTSGLTRQGEWRYFDKNGKLDLDQSGQYENDLKVNELESDSASEPEADQD